MLTSLRLKDWKSFGDGPAMPFGPLTLLVGPNGSGKSNVIDALRLLQGAALDLPIGDVLRGRYEGQREVWPGIRGYAIEAARKGRTVFQIEAESGPNTAYALTIDVLREATIRRESLDVGAHRFEAEHGIANIGLNSDVKLAFIEGGRSALGQLHKHLEPSALAVGAEELHRILREIVFLDVQPGRMREYRPEGATQLGVNAENISAVLYQLGQRDAAELQNIVDWLSELCAPSIEKFDFDRTQLGEVMTFLVEQGGTKVSARSISDGTLRFLGMVAALLTVPAGSMIVVEEPDVGLHPSRIHLLASLLEDAVKRRSLQVIATTHSPTLLSHLLPETLSDVVAFGRDLEDGTTVGRRIGDLPHFETLQKSNELEHLVSTGWLERAL